MPDRHAIDSHAAIILDFCEGRVWKPEDPGYAAARKRIEQIRKQTKMGATNALPPEAKP